MKVIKIGAVWCNGCIVMRPRWAEVEKENSWLKTVYFDFDTDRDKINKYKIDSGVLPVFIFIDKKGNEIERITGEIEKNKIIELINKYKDK